MSPRVLALFDVDGTQVAVALALVAVTSTARCFGARMKKEDGFFSFSFAAKILALPKARFFCSSADRA